MGTKTLFRQLDLTINAGDRIGLVGHNGSGKSTLLSILNSSELADDGDISRNRGLHMASVEQFIDPRLHNFSLLDSVTEKLPDEDKTAGQYKAEKLLTSLGFSDDEFGYLVSDLSGGQQNRLMFARAMINDPNLILFDEPTNHLDLRTLLVFETYLHTIRAAFVLISHDREFLDAVTTRTLFLRDERLYGFDLPYSQAKSALDDHDEAALAARELEEKNIRRLEASASRLATWGKVYDNEKLARKAKSMEKRIEKLKDEKTFISRGSGLNLTLDVGSAHANRMIAIEQQAILAPDGTELFRIDDLVVKPGERIALLGQNGAGKTTLINLIMDRFENDREGDVVKFNPQCQVGYYDQEMQRLDMNLSLTQTLQKYCKGSDSTFKTQLIKAGFPYLDLDKKLKVLSGGERARITFLILKLNQPNFLILDEPTNHIDIQGKEDLEAQILETNATALITSHDRRFVDNIADRYVMISNGTLKEINRAEAFYKLVPISKQSSQPQTPDASTALSEEDMLMRLIELEERLEADRARKPKFQKAKLQATWQAEITRLTTEINNS